MKEDLNTALKGMGERLGIDLALDDQGRIAVAIGEVEMAVILPEGTSEARLYAIVGEAPEEAGARFFRVLMGANHMGRMTDGASLGLDLDQNAVTLSTRLPTDHIDDQSLEAALERLANAAQAWRDNLEALVAADRRAASDAGAPAPAAPDAGAWLKL